MKAKHAPVILNLLDMERGTDDCVDEISVGPIKAKIARRPGRWRRKMTASAHTPPIWEPELPEAA